MSVYNISYDLGGPESSTSYKNLIEAIKNLGYWTKPLESYWFISTSKNSKQIRESLENFLDKNDKLVIIELTSKDWATQGLPDEVLKWMHSNI